MTDTPLSIRMRWGLGLWIAGTALYYYVHFSLAFYQTHQASIEALFK